MTGHALRAVHSRWIRSFRLIAAAGALACSTQSAGAQVASNWMERYARPATFDVEVEHIMMPMRDGVRLATSVFYPARNGQRPSERMPALLVRHMGDSRVHDDRYANEARYFASRGYVVANQTMRGRMASEGDAFYLYGKQDEDGADAVEWLATQPWSSGRVGTFGVSHAGVAQYSLATANPRGLGAMVPAFAQSNYALWSMRTGGALEMRYINWATGAATIGREAQLDPTIAAAAAAERERLNEYLANPPFLFDMRRGHSPLRFTPSYEDWLISMIEHSEYPASDGFWTDPGLNLTLYYESMADVPTMHHSGWYDTYPRAHSDNWIALAPIKRQPQWLLLGPWTHISALPRFSGDADFGDDAGGDYNQVRLAWFDQWLRDQDTGVATASPVKIFVMGGGDGRRNMDGRLNHGGYWLEADDWPLPETKPTRYYLHEGGVLETSASSAVRAATTFRFDPSNPVPTIGGNVSAFGQYLQPGAFNQVCRAEFLGCKDELPLAQRPDVLVFETPPLEEDVTIAGYIRVVLHGSSTGVDTDFTAKLVDVYPPSTDYPDGYAMNIADGIIRARFRDGRAQEKLMTPGTTYEFVIEPYPTANLFRKGHRIRLDVSSSNYPRFDVNPNTGDPILRHRRFEVVDNTIHHDRNHTSYIELPIIPGGASK